jgi:hypothetical protein
MAADSMPIMQMNMFIIPIHLNALDAMEAGFIQPGRKTGNFSGLAENRTGTLMPKPLILCFAGSGCSQNADAYMLLISTKSHAVLHGF